MSVSNFISYIYGYMALLYAWLPAPIAWMLYACLGVCVIVTIIKLFAFVLDCIPFW